MKKMKGILVCLLLLLPAIGKAGGAYQPFAFVSTSAYRSSGNESSYSSTLSNHSQPVGSLAAISAANFASLNSDEEAFSPAAAAGPRRVERQDGTGGTGVSIKSSPVGDTPWLFIVLMVLSYIAVRSLLRRRRPFRSPRHSHL